MIIGPYSERRRRASKRFSRRRGFSLVELLVSIGILLFMLALAGEVMSLTVRATGQATALTEINRRLRVLERTLREDLRFVEPGRSILVIQGNPINAYWTPAEKEADDGGNPLAITSRDPALADPPRADILMFFTRRKASSFVQYIYRGGTGTSQAVSSNLQQVVYGHAELGEYASDPTKSPPFRFAKDTDAFEDFPKPSPVPAQRWHLARRSVLLLPSQPPTGTIPPWGDYSGAQPVPLDDRVILQGITDVMGNFDDEKNLLVPGDAFCDDPIVEDPFYWPDIFCNGTIPYARSLLDTTPPARLADRLGHYFLPHCASFKVEWTLDPVSDFVGGRLDRERQVLWIDPGDIGPDPAVPTDDDPLSALEAARQEASDASLSSIAAVDLFNDLDDLLNKPLGLTREGIPPGKFSPYSLAQRFRDDPLWKPPLPYGDGSRSNLAVFTATRKDSGGSLVPEEIFPKALRITVEMFDDQGRLGRPIRHVMVIPVGG